MRAGLLEEASACERRIGHHIDMATREHLQDVALRGDLWKLVHRMTNKPRTQDSDIGITAAELNEHFARTSINNHYETSLKRATVNVNSLFYLQGRLFHLLDRTRHTAHGVDQILA